MFHHNSCIASTTREFINYVRAYVERYFTFKSDKFWKTCWGFKNNFDLTNGKIFLMLYSNCVFNARDHSFSTTQDFLKKQHFLHPGMHTYVCVSGGKKCYFFLGYFAYVLNGWSPRKKLQCVVRQKIPLFARDNAGVYKNFLLKSFIIKLSINLIRNASIFKPTIERLTSVWNLEQPDIIEKGQDIIVKTRPILYYSEMKLLKFEYTSVKVGLWWTDVLRPVFDLEIKISKKAVNC